MNKLFIDFLPYLASAGGAFSWLMAWREKKAAANIKAGDALKIMQQVYAQFAQDTAIEIGQLKEEVKMLRAVVESYKQTCDKCPHKNSQ